MVPNRREFAQKSDVACRKNQRISDLRDKLLELTTSLTETLIFSLPYQLVRRVIIHLPLRASLLLMTCSRGTQVLIFSVRTCMVWQDCVDSCEWRGRPFAPSTSPRILAMSVPQDSQRSWALHQYLQPSSGMVSQLMILSRPCSLTVRLIGSCGVWMRSGAPLY